MKKKSEQRPNEKKAAIQAWGNATNGKKLTPLLKAIGEAITKSKRGRGTFLYAHQLGRFSYRIANRDNLKHSHWACLGYNEGWKGEWRVTNHDLKVYAEFEMWFDRYFPDSRRCETGRIAEALKRKRMRQALSRYRSTGLLKEHCLMIGKLLWEIETGRGDWVSLFAQGKRPFGDSSREQSIYQACGWPMPWHDREDGEMTEAQKETAWDIFDELPFAMPDAAKKAMRNL